MQMINQASLDLIKRFEGCKLTAYQDSVGVWTIGYGTTAAAGVGCAPHAGMTITQADADQYLSVAVSKFSDQVLRLLAHPATPNQFGAMVSLAYNIGPGNFAKSSVLRDFNAGDLPAAAAAFALWNKAGGQILPGLVARRAAEAKLFLTP